MKIRDQWGLVNEMVHPQNMQVIMIRLTGPLRSSQPYKQLCSSHHSELSAQFKPSPKTIKRKDHHTCKHVLVPFMTCCVELRTLSVLIQIEKRSCRGCQAMPIQRKMVKPVTAAHCFNTQSTDSETRKRPSASLYLNELPAIKM